MEIRVRRAETGDLDGIEELYGRAGDAEEGRLDGSGGNGASIRCGRMPRRDWKPARSTLRSWTDRSPAR